MSLVPDQFILQARWKGKGTPPGEAEIDVSADTLDIAIAKLKQYYELGYAISLWHRVTHRLIHKEPKL